MGVKQVRCPECSYSFFYATAGNKGSYKIGSDFAERCARGKTLKTLDAFECPALRAAAERELGLDLSNWAGRSPEQE